jgi:hypothetical protein
MDQNRQYIREAMLTFQGMAHTREVFKEHLQEKIDGALHEYLKAKLAEKNGYTKWVQHWYGESDQLLKQMGSLMSSEIKIRGFKDKNKALSEVISYIKAHHSDLITNAYTQIKRDFTDKSGKFPTLKNDLTPQDESGFWSKVEAYHA